MTQATKVLMIEDSPSLTEVYKAYLADTDYHVVAVESLAVAHATLEVRNKHDDLLLTYSSDEQASYTFTVKEKGKNYPVRFMAYDGTDMVTGTIPDFVMTSALLRPAKKSRGNINPHS